MGTAVNPILTELQGLSPGAQAALKMAGQTLSAPPAQPTAWSSISPMAAPKITPQMKTAATGDAGPPPNLAPMKMPGSDPIPQLGTPALPNVKLAPQERGTLLGDQAERARLLQTGAGEDQIAHRIENSGFGQNHHILGSILGNVAQGAAKLGDIGLSTVAPEIAINTPGTEYHHMADVNHADKAVAQDEANAGKEAQAGRENAEAGKSIADTTGRNLENQNEPQKAADAHAASVAGTANVESETRDRDSAAAQGPSLATAYAHRVNQVVQAGGDPSTDPIVQHLGDAITSIQRQSNPAAEQPKPVQIDGKPGFAVETPNGWVDAGTRQPIHGNVTPIPPPPNFASIYPMVTGGRATDAATTKWQQESGAYQGTLNTLAQAKTGSELSASLVPLGLALVTPTAAGVHRINTAEIAQAGSQIGSLGRRLDAALAKAGSGSLPPETIREAEQFVKMYQALKYKQYLAQVKQASDTFRMSPDQTFVTSMDGQSEMSLADALKQNSQNASGDSGTIRVQIPGHAPGSISADPNADDGSNRNASGGGPTQPNRPANVPEGYVHKDGPKGKGWYKPTK